MESEKKVNRENNNTSLPVQIEWCRKLINEVNNKYRQFTLATSNTIEELNKARILMVEKMEKTERIPISNGLERHHLGHTSYLMDKINHPWGESRHSFLHQKRKFSEIN